MTNEQAAAQIEALLFALGKPLSRNELREILGKVEVDLENVLTLLSQQKKTTGVVLVDDGVVVELRTAPSTAELIERIRKEEYTRDLGKPGLETLAAVLYRGPLTRSEIDFIRGVNSSQILRTLTIRGLLRKIPNPKDTRSFLYEPTTELLSEFGISQVRDLPEYDVVREKLTALETNYRGQQEIAETL